MGWKKSFSAALFKQFFVLLTTFVRLEGAALPEDIRLRGVEGLGMLLERCGRGHVIGAVPVHVTSEVEMPVMGYSVSVLLEIYQQTGCIALQGKCMDVLSLVLFDHIGEKVFLCRFLPGIMSSICQALEKGKVRNSGVVVQSVALCERLINVCFADASVNGLDNALGDSESVSQDVNVSVYQKNTQEDTPGALGSRVNGVPKVFDTSVKILSPEWLSNTRNHIHTVLAILMKLKTHPNQRVRRQILHISFKVVKFCFKTLNNCVKLSLSTILFLAGDQEKSIQDASVDSLFLLEKHQGCESEFWDIIDMFLKEYFDAWPRVYLLNDEDVKRRHLIAMMHIVSLLSKRYTKLGFVSDFLVHGISDSLHFAMDTRISKNTSLVQPVSHFCSEDLLENDMKYELTFPSFRFVNIESNLTFLVLEKIFVLFGKYSSVEFLNFILYKIKISTCESRTNVLRWILLCNLRDIIEHYDSYTQYNDSLNLETSIENIYVDIYTDSLNHITDFLSLSYDESIYCNISQNKVVRICLDLEIIALTAKKLGKEFRIELVDCLYSIVYLLGSFYEDIVKHARICLNSLAIYCGYNSVQELLIENVDYLINAINLRLNTFDVMPTGPSILMILLRLLGSSIVPYLEDVIDSVFVVLDNYHGYSKLVAVFFSFLNEVIQVNGNVERPRIYDMSKNDNIHIVDPCLEVMHIIDKIHSLYHKNIENVNEISSELSNYSPENLPSNMNKITFKIIQKISDKSQMFLNHQSPNIRNGLLKMLSTSIPLLSLDEKSFLPFVNDIWPLIIGQLNLNEMTSVILSALDVVSLLCIYAKDFMTSRLSKNGIKILCDLLNMNSQKTNFTFVNRFSKSIKIQNKIFEVFDAAVENVKLPDKTIDKIIESVICFFKESRKTLEIETLMRTFERKYSDKLWLSMLPFIGFKDTPPLPEEDLFFPDVVL
ncbi:hypothetical protein PORY_002447 [Pneumocystis oryctolagi]|uniref:Uncharacterized protein n=1 Tax=Pneumocystis oryctolagi TaxID=42067 RepID=A0ACB7CAX7_9ASCO|nr:hypothetical protein PORY_002447 [Pneumocystis oryctolagi]